MEVARLDISFEVAGCVNRCRHCYARQSPPASDLVDIGDIRHVDEQVTATGMEADIGYLSSPLAHSHWREILRLSQRRHGQVQAPINGIRWREDQDWRAAVSDMRASGLWGVQLSLYGIGPTHDKFAGSQGDFERAVTTARRFMECGVTLWCIQVFAHHGNASELDDVLGFARDLQAENRLATKALAEPLVNLLLPSYAGRWADVDDLILTPKDLASVPADVRAALAAKDLRTESDWMVAVDAGEVSPADWAAERASRQERVSLLIDPSLEVRRRRDSSEVLGSLQRAGLAGMVEKCLRRPDPELERFAALGDAEVVRRYAEEGGKRLYERVHVFSKWFRAACARVRTALPASEPGG